MGWPLPLSPSGRVNKAGLFLQFSGGRAGPDGLALTANGVDGTNQPDLEWGGGFRGVP